MTAPVYVAKPASLTERVERKCLCCGERFVVRSRFVRLCSPCKKTDGNRVEASRFAGLKRS
jgi:hypothetical protein